MRVLGALRSANSGNFIASLDVIAGRYFGCGEIEVPKPVVVAVVALEPNLATLIPPIRWYAIFILTRVCDCPRGKSDDRRSR